jgi:hypothetical protein
LYSISLGTFRAEQEVLALSGTVATRKRLLRITAGNLRNNHIYIAEHYDFFPKGCIGPSSRRAAAPDGITVRIFLVGLNRTVETDIGTEADSGKPRRMFRGRQWVREFFEKHNIQPGDVLDRAPFANLASTVLLSHAFREKRHKLRKAVDTR